MRFRVEPKPPRDKREWHHWFAWRPVRHGPYVYWLQWMNRKGTWHHDGVFTGCWVYEYQELEYYY